MKIHLSSTAGFCDGVKRAYEMINNLDMDMARKPVRILGSLVHNPDVVRKIEEKGITKVTLEDFLNAKENEIGTLIITAHGIGPSVFEIAKEKGIAVIDTTCPRVIKVQRLAQVFWKRGYEVVLIGDKEHSEVNGIYEWGGKKAQIISNREELSKLKIDADAKVAVISQTTQNEEFFNEVAEAVKKLVPKAEILSTICHATHDRQAEVKKLAREFDAVVVIGSPMSANSTRLYEISRELNPRTFFVENSSEIKVEDLANIETVAVMAGASTPDWIIEDVMTCLSKSYQ